MECKDVEILIKKGRRPTAAYLQGVFSSGSNSTNSGKDIAEQIFDRFLNPNVRIDDWEAIDWCKWLLAGGLTPDEFVQTVRKYDYSTTCGLVWITNFVAYRCRTCGISPCMSLCSECFQKGDHHGHDYNMFRSQAGGACDCGDINVMKEFGFCEKHNHQRLSDQPKAPTSLVCVADNLMPRLYLKLIQHLREYNEPESADRYHTAIHNAVEFLSLLQNCSEMGAAMRTVMAQTLINPKIYFELAVEDKKGYPCQEKASLAQYLNAIRNLRSIDENDTLMWSTEWYEAKILELQSSCFLHELVFWTIKYEFPQKLVCLLLNIMPDKSYKEAFTKIFVKHYGRISRMLSRTKDADTLSNRVVHVSVQLFSNEMLSYQMAKYYDLLDIMVRSLECMMSAICIPSTRQNSNSTNKHLVVDCSHQIMKEHCYWPLISDLNNVLTHCAVSYQFLNNRELIKKWFKFITMFQGMNVNTRELVAHVEFESNTYYAAFSAELEICATPMWALISHLKSPDNAAKAIDIINICVEALGNWFALIGLPWSGQSMHIHPYEVSFHLPLHRTFVLILGQAVKLRNAPLDAVLPSVDILKFMMLHPLHIAVVFHEIICNMWVRSGLQIKGQTMTYVQCHFCNSTVDADIFLLQLCAMKLDPDWFLQTVLEKFHVLDWFSFKKKRKDNFLDIDKVLPMLEAALAFLCTLLTMHNNIGLDDEQITRQEMVALLCMSDRTHSQLMELLPDRCEESSQHEIFETILSQIADYKAPNFEAGGAMMQGTYVPKSEIWENEFNPLLVLLRSVHRREYQNSLDRYAQYLKQHNNVSGARVWPPFRVPSPVHDAFIDPCRILHCKTMHGIIFTILYRAMNDPEVSEQLLTFCMYLLDLAVRTSTEGLDGNEILPTTSDSKSAINAKFNTWFESEGTITNMLRTITRVEISDVLAFHINASDDMKMDVDFFEEDYIDGQRFRASSHYTVLHAPSPDIVEDDNQVSSTTATTPFAFTPNQLALLSGVVPSSNSQMVSVANNGPSTSTKQEPLSLVQISGQEVANLTNYNQSVSVHSPPETSMDVSTSPNGNQPLALLPSEPQGALPPTQQQGALLPVQQSGPLVPAQQSGPLVAVQEPPELDSLELLEDDDDEDETIGFQQAMIVQAPDSTTDQVNSIEAVWQFIPIQNAVEPLPLPSTSGNTAPNNIVSVEVFSGQENNASRNAFQTRVIRQKLEKFTDIHESMLSLLLQLHSKLSERPDSYRLKETGAPLDDSRVGGGEQFIGKVIDRIARTQSIRDHVDNLRKKLWPKINPTEKSETVDKEARRRRAKERQQKLMAEFASKQKAFMQETLKDGDSAEGSCPIDMEDIPIEKKEYECVICSQMSASEHDRPMGMVVLLQSTSVLGHYNGVSNRRLPINESEAMHLHNDTNMAEVVKSRISLMAQYFDSRYWPMAVNIGWEGGVYVQTCGHYLHIDCHRAYIQSLKQSSRIQNLAVELGEYNCPLCRQLANSVIPLVPDMKESQALAHNSKRGFGGLSHEISELLMSPLSQDLKKNYMGGIMEDITNATQPVYRSFYDPNPSSLSLFISSVARTNLEIELVQRSTLLEPLRKKKQCFVPLLNALSLHYNFLSETIDQKADVAHATWKRLVGEVSEDLFSVSVFSQEEVPLILRDPVAMLLQIILSLPINLDKAYFRCVIQTMYNLVFVQALQSLSTKLKLSNFEKLCTLDTNDLSQIKDEDKLQVLLAFVISNLKNCNFYLDDDEMDQSEVLETNARVMENYVHKYIKHFLKIAVILQSHMYEETIDMKAEENDTEYLCHFLGLSDKSGADFYAASAFQWPSDSAPMTVIGQWCKSFVCFALKSIMTARRLSSQIRAWVKPSLLQLPHNYDDIFTFYHKRACQNCQSEPKDPSLCLICGRMVCLREICCRVSGQYEAVEHSQTCGAGTAIFLVVNSSTIIVIRGKRACLWGSVYLDSYGEEDRDLKRGKPLFLSQDRYRLLIQQWINHSFDHTNKRWVWHKDNL